MMLLSGTTEGQESTRSRCRELEREVASVSVPLAYASEQYHLRLHIHLLQERLDTLAAGALRDVGTTGVDALHLREALNRERRAAWSSRLLDLALEECIRDLASCSKRFTVVLGQSNGLRQGGVGRETSVAR